MHSTSPPSASPGLAHFLAAQLGQFVGLLAQLCGLGLLSCMWRRQLSWRAAVGAMATLMLWTGTTAFVCTRGGVAQFGAFGLWASCALGALVSGFVAGWVGRRLAFWENYLSCLCATGLWMLQLGGGASKLFRLAARWLPGLMRAARLDPFDEAWTALVPGHKWLGPMWDRAMLLAMITGFLLAVTGGSLAWVASVWARGRNFGFEVFVARRHVEGLRPGSVSLTAVVGVVGVALGVGSLITVTAVMSGYQEDVEAKILATNAHLIVQKYGADFYEHQEVLQRALVVDGVEAGTAFAFNEAMLSTDIDSIAIMLKGIDPQTAPAVTDIAQQVSALAPAAGKPEIGTLLADTSGPPGALLGHLLLQRLDKKVGDVVTLTVPAGMRHQHVLAPRRMAVRVAGTFRSGMYEFDARLVYVRLQAAQVLLNLEQTVSGLELRLRAPQAVDAVAPEVYRAIGRYPYTTRGWKEMNAPLFMALRLQKIVMFLVLCCIVVVASFNIASTLFMAVVERARDIAVLKSMGARDPHIMKIFMLQGFWVGLAGTLLGVAVGLTVSSLLGKVHLSIAADVYMVESLQIHIKPLEVGLVVLAALVIAHLATLYPALRAAAQRPVDAMRYD